MRTAKVQASLRILTVPPEPILLAHVNDRLRENFSQKNCITKTCLYNFDPFKPHFYIVKLGFTGEYIIFLISAQKHRLWYSLEPPQRVPTIYVFEQKCEKYQFFYLKIFSFWSRNFLYIFVRTCGLAKGLECALKD